MKYLSAIAAFAAAVSLVTVLNVDNDWGNGGLHITQRVLDGTIEPRVREIHTDRNTLEFASQAYKANMKALRRHALCASQPEACRTSFDYNRTNN